MEAAQSIERYCNAPTRQGGGRCRRPAGWGTPGNTGPCKIHGGALPNVRKHHARVEMLEFARGRFGQELDVDPLEGVLMAVRFSYGLVDAWRHKLATGVTPEDRQEYARALEQYARICKLANDAGVSDRQIKILERMAEKLTLAFEASLPAFLSAEDRQASVLRFGAEVARLEQPTIDGTTVDA